MEVEGNLNQICHLFCYYQDDDQCCLDAVDCVGGKMNFFKRFNLLNSGEACLGPFGFSSMGDNHIP